MHARIPRQTTLRELFSRYLDVTAVPRRSFFTMLRRFAKSELEAEKLDEFCSVEGAVGGYASFGALGIQWQYEL